VRIGGERVVILRVRGILDDGLRKMIRQHFATVESHSQFRRASPWAGQPGRLSLRESLERKFQG
jgi:hypothetical protein